MSLEANAAYFDEVYGADGQVRPHYAAVMDHWQSVPRKAQRELQARSKRLFAGDYAQDPLPRVLTQTEFRLLSRGVEQRARAILAFLRDYCVKGNRWNRIIPATAFHTMMERHHVGKSLSEVKPDQLAFPYGPDIIRDRAGRWKVVEDSAGILGGIGDLVESREILYRLMPGLRNVFDDGLGGVNEPREYFERLARHFSQRAAANGGIPLLYLRAYKDEVDQETRRLARTFAQFGIESTTAGNRSRRIVVREGKDAGIFLKSGSSIERIGALVVHAGPEQLDGRSIRIAVGDLRNPKSLVRLRIVSRQFMRALKTPSLKAALLNGRAWTNFSPGTQFINDKFFGLFVDTMIRRFLRETPHLESVPAQPLAVHLRGRGWKLDRSVLASLRRDKDRYVVKRVDEDGGSGVWIGRNESKNSLSKIVASIAAAPEKYIVQDFEHLSVLDNRIVDLRIHAHVDSERIIVSNTPWGRANWIRGNGKVNIGSGGFTSPVVVVEG